MYDGHSSHVGQIFFEQDPITEVEKTGPYSTNTQSLTENADDSILQTEADTTDPFMEYVLLGDSFSDVNAKRDDSLSPEGYWTEDGGEVNDNFEMNMAGMGDIAAAIPSTSASAAATGSA
ncbi:extracellular dioxygenase [Aspergillus luchuensis]|uniref:Extracellular dioxygenase n=1 Tax=Aspergillus kawachii TaxID=1069201 RepID=A0A146FYZ8_ASPKA|nr:extracellular dioxygenase [Aspergillus luchuensis]